MTTSPYRPVSQQGWHQLRGAVALTGTGFQRVAHRVQQMHERIAEVSFRNLSRAPLVNVGSAAVKPLHDGITSGVYGAVRGIGGVAFRLLDGLLQRAEQSHLRQLRPANMPAPLLSAVNGAFGDYLLRQRNPLALRMGFYHHGKPLQMTQAAPHALYPQASGNVVVFIHGLCCDESSWQLFSSGEHAGNHPYAELLAQQGYTPFFLRYNTGISIEQNGRLLAQILNKLYAAYPQPLARLVLIGHSMGGLVARAACSHGVASAAAWSDRISHVFCLGSPHLGAPLEKVAHLGTRLMQAFDVTQPLAEMIDDRSTGIKDLRHGKSARKRPPLPAHVPMRPPQAHFHFIGSTMGLRRGNPLTKWLGDGLVRLDSATADHLADDISVLEGLNHMQLLNHPRVYAILAQRLGLTEATAQ